MSLDIYDDLEHLVPAERRDAFLRLSRQIKEYGDHNPELLRLVEVMGFLSLYTNDLPKRIAVEIDRGWRLSRRPIRLVPTCVRQPSNYAHS